MRLRVTGNGLRGTAIIRVMTAARALLVIPAFVGENLPPGVHSATVDEVEASLVVAFPTSSSRPPIFEGWRRHRNAVSALLPPSVQWVDGSYVSTKINPGDIDVVTHVDGQQFDALDPASQAAVRALFAGSPDTSTFLTDAYAIAEYPLGHVARPFYEQVRAYWEWRWSTARDGTSKGFVEVS